MDNTNDIQNEEQTGRLQQPAVGGSLPPAQQIRKWCREAHCKAEQYRSDGIEEIAGKYYAMAMAYSKCVTLLERQ